MSSNWQSWITLGVIILTLTIFLCRAVIKHRSKNDGCGHDCGCPSKPDLKKKDDSES